MHVQRLLVAVDGSANGRAAVEWSAGLAALTGARVLAVHALGLLERDEHGDVVPAQPRRAEVEARLRSDWCAPLSDAVVTHECIVRDGDPVTVILGTADEYDVDMVVVGSRGLGGYPELLLGSTSTQVAQRSSRPVVIVPERHAAGA